MLHVVRVAVLGGRLCTHVFRSIESPISQADHRFRGKFLAAALRGGPRSLYLFKLPRPWPLLHILAVPSRKCRLAPPPPPLFSTPCGGCRSVPPSYPVSFSHILQLLEVTAKAAGLLGGGADGCGPCAAESAGQATQGAQLVPAHPGTPHGRGGASWHNAQVARPGHCRSTTTR